MKANIKLLATMSAALLSGNALAACDNTNLSVWSATSNNGSINVNEDAAMSGTECGLEIGVNHSTKSYVADQNPTNEQRYRQAMCVDPNSIDLPTSGSDRKLKFHNIQCTNGSCSHAGIVQFKLQQDSSQGYQIRGFVADANSNDNRNKWTANLNDAPNRVEYDLDLSAGTFKLWVNASSESDTPAVDLSNLDLTSIMAGGVSEMRIGQVNKPSNVSTSETIYVDEPESRRQTFIGGSCN